MCRAWLHEVCAGFSYSVFSAVYLKDPENPRRWKIDPVAADVVRRIFSMCMEGRGPKQITNQMKADKVLTPASYKTLQGIKSPNKKPEDP